MLLDTTKRDDYLLMCALRGPDNPSAANTKWVLTARLRALCGVKTHLSGADVRKSPVNVQDIIGMMQEVENRVAPRHYLDHLFKGSRALAFRYSHMPAYTHLSDLALCAMNGAPWHFTIYQMVRMANAGLPR